MCGNLYASMCYWEHPPAVVTSLYMCSIKKSWLHLFETCPPLSSSVPSPSPSFSSIWSLISNGIGAICNCICRFRRFFPSWCFVMFPNHPGGVCPKETCKKLTGLGSTFTGYLDRFWEKIFAPLFSHFQKIFTPYFSKKTLSPPPPSLSSKINLT